MKETYIVYTNGREIDSNNSDSDNDSEFNKFKHLDKGWSYVILFASFSTCCLVGANNYGTGIIHNILLERYKESVVLTSWSGSLQLALMCLSAPLSSAVIDKYSCRTSVILSGILFICGYLATAFAPSMHIAIFTCGITAGIAAGMGYTASIVVVGFQFRRRKQIALGITLSGMGAGIFAFAPLMDFAHAHYGSSGFFITMATLSANIITFGTLLIPNKIELYTHKQRKIDSQTQNSNKHFISVVKMYSEAVLKKPILLLSITMFTFCAGTDLVFLNLPTFVVNKGFSSIQAAFIVSLNGILSVVGRFMTGCLANRKRVNMIWLYSSSLFIVSGATFIYPFIAKFYAGHIIFNVVLGLFFASGYVLLSPLCSYFVSIEFVSAAIGFVFFFGGLGSFFGPMFAGFLLDSGSTYNKCLYSSGTLVLIAAILGLLTSCFKPKLREETCNDTIPIMLSYHHTELGQL